MNFIMKKLFLSLKNLDKNLLKNKLDKIKFDSYELDLQRMVWFQNQDFAKLYFDGNMRYTELDLFEDYYDFRKECVCS